MNHGDTAARRKQESEGMMQENNLLYRRSRKCYDQAVEFRILEHLLTLAYERTVGV